MIYNSPKLLHLLSIIHTKFIIFSPFSIGWNETKKEKLFDGSCNPEPLL